MNYYSPQFVYLFSPNVLEMMGKFLHRQKKFSKVSNKGGSTFSAQSIMTNYRQHRRMTDDLLQARYTGVCGFCFDSSKEQLSVEMARNSPNFAINSVNLIIRNLSVF